MRLLRTFGRVKTQRLAVGPVAAAVESFDSGVVQRIEMQAVHCADGLFAAVNLLRVRKEKKVRDSSRPFSHPRLAQRAVHQFLSIFLIHYDCYQRNM